MFKMLSTLGEQFSRCHFEMFFLFFPKNSIWHFIQILSNGANLHKMSKLIFWEKNKHILSLSSAYAQMLDMPRCW